MTSLEIIANIIGVLAAVVFVLSYQMKRRFWIVLLGAVAKSMFVAQYLLLGAFEGAVLDVIGALAAIVAQRKDARYVKKLLPALILLTHLSIIGVGILLYENIFSIFVIAATTFHTGALWFNKEKIIRRLSLVGSPCWLVYNVANKAYPSAVSDSFAIVSILIAMFRYDFRPKPVKSPAEELVHSSLDAPQTHSGE